MAGGAVGIDMSGARAANAQGMDEMAQTHAQNIDMIQKQAEMSAEQSMAEANGKKVKGGADAVKGLV